MKAVRIHEPTGISGLVYEDSPDPTPMVGDVLVKVAACGITHNELDYPTWTCRNGHQRDSIIPGQEVSGVVTALGLGTAGIAVGDEVFGKTDGYRDGAAAAAEYVAVEARNLAPKPQTADHVHAAAVPRAGLTAWQALFDHGKLAKGQTVLIHGAGGAASPTRSRRPPAANPRPAADPGWHWTRRPARSSGRSPTPRRQRTSAT
jgi:NADPH:quinone reductase-like Zn-dependent oxidoreductase